MKRTYLQIIMLCCLIIFPILYCQGQTTENIKASFKDGIATITYDLVGIPGRELYRVYLYCSHDNFAGPLKLVSGDVGINNVIKAGKLKKIEWEATKEMGKADESVTFQIKSDWVGTQIDNPIVFLNPNGGFMRRGHAFIIDWQGGKIGTEKELLLYKGTELVTSIGKSTIWTYTWKIPKHLKKGDDYTIKLVGQNESGVSNPFTMKPRFPLWVKLSPIIVAAAIIPFLGGSKTSEKALPNAPVPE